MTDYRFVTCPECEGLGIYVTGHGRWPDGSENNEEHPCKRCGGAGSVEQEVGPVERDDDIAAREECERRGIDPDEICADGGVTAWMVVGKEMAS